MLQEWISVPDLGLLPSLKVTEILQILHDRKRGGGWTHPKEEELVYLKVNVVRASSSLPSLPHPSGAALLSTFFQPRWERRRAGQEERRRVKNALYHGSVKAPLSRR
ncbi:hypothetical protein DPEC_G00046850 [Dallia pectoralis]|uniref:Uncharacterized protein n=1 Tax=Dallia pectoralis TaxID=75939 RepID=A0ACC2HA10_DALPE|nr:hypothetical protein DPEC_G00046850 [Dallia pectoralis]